MYIKYFWWVGATPKFYDLIPSPMEEAPMSTEPENRDNVNKQWNCVHCCCVCWRRHHKFGYRNQSLVMLEAIYMPMLYEPVLPLYALSCYFNLSLLFAHPPTPLTQAQRASHEPIKPFLLVCCSIPTKLQPWALNFTTRLFIQLLNTYGESVQVALMMALCLFITYTKQKSARIQRQFILIADCMIISCNHRFMQELRHESWSALIPNPKPSIQSKRWFISVFLAQ